MKEERPSSGAGCSTTSNVGLGHALGWGRTKWGAAGGPRVHGHTLIRLYRSSPYAATEETSSDGSHGVTWPADDVHLHPNDRFPRDGERGTGNLFCLSAKKDASVRAMSGMSVCDVSWVVAYQTKYVRLRSTANVTRGLTFADN